MQEEPLFNWLTERSVGCLAHISCLPSRTGIGVLGNSTRAFLDLLQDCGMTSWQICPIGPTGYGDSPYSSFSAFAGNPYFIDWQDLIATGLVLFNEVDPLLKLSAERVDYAALHRHLTPLAQKVGKRWLQKNQDLDSSYTFDRFCNEAHYWLDDYARFRVLKNAFGGQSWTAWPTRYRNSSTARELPLPEGFSEDDILIEKFIQYVFYYQWRRVRRYANERGIKIIGDLPIFVAQDSADVWAHPELFLLKKSGSPKVVAGVPPDYFSADGQHWGNPLYAWPAHRREGYAWWIQRMRTTFLCADIVRLDHFRGFEAYWEIPAGAPNARGGKWVKGPGIELFKAIKDAVPQSKIIAEDLGFITEEVNQLREACGFPGMAILQFAFGGEADNVYLPHNLIPNQVVYPGSHDNDASLGWYAKAAENVTDHFRRYFGVDGSTAGWDHHQSLLCSPLQNGHNTASGSTLSRI